MKTSCSGKIWHLRGERNPQEKISESFFRIREISPKNIAPSHLSDLDTADELPSLAEAAERIFTAIEKKEKILLFGDFDLDGASGVAVLFFALRKIGAQVFPKLPKREEGYGLSFQILDTAQKSGISLVITTDCGASNVAEIEYGNTLGIDTIITDHHSIGKKLPPAIAIVHPHLGEETSENWHLTGAGVAFFLAKKLLEMRLPGKNLEAILAQLLEIAVLGTVADVGKLVGNNRTLTALGLREIQKSRHPGIGKLLEMAKIPAENCNAESIAFFLAPRLNAAGRLDHPHLALKLLLGDARVAPELERLNAERREIVQSLLCTAETLLGGEIPPAIVLFSEDFFPGVSGLIAAQLAEKYHRPTVIGAPAKGKITASCRGPEDFHLANTLRELSNLLEKSGGHAAAAGFSIHPEKWEDFVIQFSAKAEKARGVTPPPPFLLADFSVRAEDFFAEDFKDIFAAAPFGEGNPAPSFLLKKTPLKNIRRVGEDRSHLFAQIFVKHIALDVIFFRGGNIFPEEKWEKTADLLVAPEFSSFRGERKLRFKILDIRILASPIK